MTSFETRHQPGLHSLAFHFQDSGFMDDAICHHWSVQYLDILEWDWLLDEMEVPRRSFVTNKSLLPAAQIIITEPSEQQIHKCSGELKQRKHYNFSTSKQKVLQNKSTEQQKVNYPRVLNISPRVVFCHNVPIRKSQNRKVRNASHPSGFFQSELMCSTCGWRHSSSPITGDNR